MFKNRKLFVCLPFVLISQVTTRAPSWRHNNNQVQVALQKELFDVLSLLLEIRFLVQKVKHLLKKKSN